MSELLELVRRRKNPVILDEQDRFLFFPNSKVAQRSITRELLKDRVIVWKDNHFRWEDRFRKIDENYLARVFKFTIVRNPFDRTVSAFFHLKEKCSGYEFNHFVQNVLARTGVGFDAHFNEQTDGLFFQDKLVVDYVGRFESLRDSWKDIAARIDAPARLPHRGKSKRNQGYRDYFAPESRRVIETIYGEDLRRFGYSFEDEPVRKSWFRR